MIEKTTNGSGNAPTGVTQRTIDDLLSENARLKARIEEFESAERQTAADELVIQDKMARGLSREQAIAVIKRQREFDAARAVPVAGSGR